MTEDREKLIEYIVRYAYREGTFTLVSGQQASYYIDGKLATLRGDFLWSLGQVLVDWAIQDEAEAIGGMSIGADPLAVAAAMVAAQRGLNITGFLVRKEPKRHGTHKHIEGPSIEGKKVIVVDDVVTTGGSIMEAFRKVCDSGGQVTRLASIVHRGPGSGKNELVGSAQYTPIFDIEEIQAYVEKHRDLLLPTAS